MQALPPLVYLGPSLEASAARELLPGAQLMPPIRRGDLYRDRLLGFRVFLILDGVFCDQAAISPREVIDVVRDGCMVAGASSMGAIRAAECWPAGMMGIGSIYRLYRRGLLLSDDEVAVAFCPAPPYRASGASLINVRYALARLVRSGLFTPGQANGILRAASELHYSNRDWPNILSSAGIGDPDESLTSVLVQHDLKRLDAARALRTIGRWVGCAAPTLLQDCTSAPGRSFLNRRPREAHYGPAPHHSEVDHHSLWHWMTLSGRYRRYVPGGIGADEVMQQSRVGSHNRTRVDVFREFSRHDGPTARVVWGEVTRAGELDAVVMRYTAIKRAAQWARVRGLIPEWRHWDTARAEIAANHGFCTWDEIRGMLAGDAEIWTALERCCEEAALAKRTRQELFNRESSTGKQP